jgi:hypothetical protein
MQETYARCTSTECRRVFFPTTFDANSSVSSSYNARETPPQGVITLASVELGCVSLVLDRSRYYTRAVTPRGVKQCLSAMPFRASNGFTSHDKRTMQDTGGITVGSRARQ